MPPRPCLTCGKSSRGNRCPIHAGQVEYRRTQAKRARRPYTAAEQQRRARTVAAWRATYGDWCPGWGRAAHPSADLTADHDHAVGAGGSEGGPLTVLCRACNGRKGARR